MKKPFKLLIFTLLLMVAAMACKSNLTEEDMQTENLEELIIGKWQLVKVDEVFVPIPPPPSYDYSKYNIMYEFKANGVLTVFGETNNIERYIGHEICDHLYSFVDDDGGLGMPNLPFGLQIGTFTSWYKISSEELIINDSPLDGYIYYLIKIN